MGIRHTCIVNIYTCFVYLFRSHLETIESEIFIFGEYLNLFHDFPSKNLKNLINVKHLNKLDADVGKSVDSNINI